MNSIARFSLFIVVTLSVVLLTTCRKDVGVTGNGYPPEVSRILAAKCAVPGCHTDQSKEGAAGLSLETWDDLFAGDRNGAVCIPYRHDYSTIFLFCNTDTTLGPVNSPTMPLNGTPLSKEEIMTLIDWIDKGAPRSDGYIAFSDDAQRKKVYVTNQGCDVVTVFDAATQLQMRYYNVGISSGVESPHMVKVSPDKKHWYAIFSNAGTVIQKYRCSDDQKVGEVTLPSGSWNTFSISADSKYAYVVDWYLDARVAHVDIENMALVSVWSGQLLYPDAHGAAINPGGDTLYLTSQGGSFIMKVPVADPGTVDTVQLASSGPILSVHEIAFTPDGSHYFVTCQNGDQVRVLRTSDDAQVAVIPVGDYPSEMSFSKTKPYLFVTCEWDESPPQTNRGSVAVINYNTFALVKNIRVNMSEPHGIAVDDAHGLVYVANRNISAGEPPHHTTTCDGVNGFISFIDLNTLNSISGKRIEVAVDPYSIAVR